MATTLSSVLKKKKEMDGYNPKYDNEDNDPLRNVSGERNSASQGGGAEEYSELRTMLNKKKERERKQREAAEAVRKKQSEERAQKIRIEATKQHTTAMTDFIRSDREKVAESAIPMADAIKKYKEYKKSQQEQQIWEKAKNKIDKEEKESGIDWNNVENQYDEQYDREIIKDYKKKKLDEKKELNEQQAERNKVGVDYGESFIKYTDIPEMDDFREQVENGKNKPNAVSGLQVFTPLDYLSKDRRALRRSAKATNDWMNDDEKNVYYYLNGKFGPQAAEKYIDSLQDVLNERSATDIKANAQEFAKKHPVAGIVADALTATSTMVAYPVMVAKYGWSAANGDKDNIDPNDPMFTASVLNEGFQKGVSENESLTTLIPNENIRNFAVGTGMSMAENIGRLPMGAVGLAAAAGGAGLSATKDAAERGGNIQQSLELGAANAAAEAFFEKFSLEGLEKFKTHPGKGVREFLKNVAKQAATEGSEEVFTEIANTISDQLIMGELSQYNQEYEIYKAKGFSESEARNRAFEDFLKNVAMSGLGGAVSGGIMGAGGQILGNIENNRRLTDYGSRLNPDYRDYSEGIDTDRSSYQNEESWKEAVDLQQLAKEYADRQKNKEFIKNRDKAEYDLRMQDWFKRVQSEETAGPDVNEGFKTTPEQEFEQTAQQDQDNQAQMNEEPVREEQLAQENVQQNAEQNQAEPQTQNVQDHPENVWENPENVQETEENAQNIAEDVQEAKEYRSGYGKNGGEALVNTYDGSVDVSTYNKAFGRAYDAGYHGIEMEVAEQSALMSVLSNEQMLAAYKAGAQDYNMDHQVMPQYKQGEAKTGGLGTVSEYATADQRTMAENIGKLTGLKINLVDGLNQENATASYKPGEITLSINTADINGSLSHELTHFIKDQAPAHYEMYQNIVVEAEMKATGRSLEDLVESYTNKYADAGQELTRQEVLEEISADATQKFLNDPDFIDQVVKKDRNLAQKIIDFLSDVIDSIKNLIKTGSTRAAAKNLEQDVQMYEDARYAWLLGLEQGSKDYKAGKERADNIMQSSKYELNQFGFEEYGEKEKGWWKNNDSIIICNTKQDIADFYRDHVHKKPYARLYIGKIGPELAQRIYKDTGVNTENLNVAITSEFEDSHSNPEKERSRGQTPVTPEILSRLPEIISSYDKVENTTSSKDRKPVLKFEKDINGKNVAVEYVRSKKGMLELQTMYAWENKNSRSVSTTLTMPEKTDPYRTSETYSVITPATKDNIQPGTEKSKTRFQLKEPIEETKDLIAAHNVDADKLNKMLDYDGIPMPSIAITKAEYGWDDFGDISLIFKKDTIDPKSNKKNKVYGADAWTPTFPQIEYDINDDVFYKAREKVEEDTRGKVPEYLAEEAKRFIGTQSGNPGYAGMDGVVEAAQSNMGMKAAYLASQGIEIKDRSSKVETPNVTPEKQKVYTDFMQNIPEEIQDDVYDMLKNKASIKEIKEKYGDTLISAYLDAKVKSGLDPEIAQKQKIGYSTKAFRFTNLLSTFRKASDFQKEGVQYTLETVRDTDGINQEINSKVDKEGYDKWICNLYDGLIRGSGVSNGKDPFTPSGNLRSFSQTHYEATPEGIVKSMLAQGDGSQASIGFEGVKTLRAAAVESMNSIEEIHAKETKLQKNISEESKALMDSLDKRLYNVIDSIATKSGHNGIMDTYNVGNILQEAAKAKKWNGKAVKDTFNKYPDWKVSDADIKEIVDIVNELKELPTDMFEAKPERVVGYDEVAAVVVPDTTPESLIDKAKERGLKVVQYDPNVEDSRKNKVNAIKGVRFQLQDVDSEGNNLTDQQKEFFKDSKIVTEEGNLKVMYHGSPNEFTVFDKKKAKSSGYFGKGFYFSDSSNQAGVYGTNYEVYLNIKNPLHAGTNEITKSQLRKFIQAVAKNEDYGIDNYGYDATVTSVTNDIYGKDDFEMIQDINATCIGDFAEAVKLFNKVNKTDYDGIVVPTETVAFEPNQIKNVTNEGPTNDPDIRYQLDDVDDTMTERRIQALQYENEALKQANDLLEQQFKLTDKDAVRTEDIKKVARNILKEYGSKYSSETLERNLSKLYQYIRGADQVDGQAITEAATSMGKSILEKSVQKDTELTEHYKDLRKQIKDTKIAITDQDKADLASVGGYNEFRKRYFGKMKMGADGISIDSLYQELQGQYPELFPADVTHPADELVAIASALDQTAPQIKNPYAANMDEMAYMVGQDILSSYFDVRKPRATFADKKEAQMQKLRWQYQQKMRDYKADLKSKYDESLKQIKKQNLEESARLAEQYKNLTEADRKEQREYYKKRMDDLRNSKNQDLAAMQQRNRERIQSMRENQQAREDKRRIIKESKNLQNWLLKPTDSKHIPEGLRQSVAAFLNNIDFSANDEDNVIKTQRTSDWQAAQAAFKQILDNGGIYVDRKTGDTMTMDIDPDIAQRIQELIEKTKGIDKLDNLDAYSMGELKKTVMAMKKAITEVNNLKSNKKSGELSTLSDGVFKDLEQRRNKVEYVGPAGMGDKLLNYDMLDPQTMFGKMGDNMKSTYDALRSGLDKKTEKLRSAQEYVDNIVDKYGIKPKELREWTGPNAKTQHFKTSRGEIDLTVAQVMSLYELNKRSQARGHMYDRNGGIKQAPVVGKAKLEGTTYTPAQIKKNYRPVKVTATDVETIVKTLTPAQRALADGLQQFMGDQCAAWGNEVTMDMYGYEKFTAKNYFPITTDKNYVATRQGDAGNKASTIKNMGITKSTTPNANNPLIIEDIFDVFSRQIDNMSTYNAYVIPLSDLNKVYNYKDSRGMTEFGSSIKEEIERTFGKAGNDYIIKLVSDINGTVNKDKSVASQLVSNMKAASVAGNLRVAAQQPTAYIRATMEISPKYLARGAVTITRKGQWNLICKYAPIAQWKDWGFYRMDTSRQMKDIMFNTDSTKQRFVNATMILAEKGDQLAWNRLWRACEYECMDQRPDLKEGTEEFYNRVGKRFSEVVDKTQVVDSILHRTQIMRSQSEINQLATSFMAEPLKTYNMLYRAAADVKAEKEGSKSRAVRAATVFVLTGVATSIAASAVDMLRDDDRDKNSKEKYIDSLKSNIVDNLNLLNNIPWVKEIPSIIAGYTPTRADLSGFEDMIYAWNQIKKLKDGTSKYTPQYVAVYTAQMASKLTGIPIKSLTRDMGAVIDSIFDSAGGKADYTWLKQKYDMGSKENLEMYTKMMIQAQRNGDQDFQKKIKDDLNKAGIDNDTITNKIKTVIKSELIGKESVNPLVEVAAQAKQSYDLEAYENAVSQLTAQGYATKLVKSAIDARIKQLEGKEEIDWEAEAETEPDSLYGDILTDQSTAEDSGVTLYSNSDLLAAIGQYDNKNAKSLDPFKKMADAIVKSKMDAGKTQKEAVSAIKTSITGHYKPLWIAADRKGREEIQNVLKQLKVNGKALYTGEDWTNWNKAAKEKKK